MEKDDNTIGVNKDYKYSDLEFQVYGKEDEVLEGSRAWTKCTKYPNHEGFIPLPDFTLQHLPQRFQSQDILDYIRTRADLTVRLSVKIGPNRPDGDPFAKYRGFTTLGTGYVDLVKPRDKDCPCKECEAQGYKNKRWWQVTLNSAVHCVYDQQEAENAKVDFFYNTGDSLKNGEAKTVSGLRCYVGVKAWDCCYLELATHDDELGQRLFMAFLESISILSRIDLQSVTPTPPLATQEAQSKVMVCISHPHGQPKHITVGELRDEYDVTYKDPEETSAAATSHAKNDATHKIDFKVKYVEYDIRTCSGSSGGRVFCLDNVVSRDEDRQLRTRCTHFKANLTTGLNVGFQLQINRSGGGKPSDQEKGDNVTDPQSDCVVS